MLFRSSGALNLTLNGNVSGTGDAVLAQSGSGTITILGNGTITGDSDDGGSGNGISATTSTGQVNITTGAGGFISGFAENGIDAQKTGGGSAGITIVTAAGIGNVSNQVDQVGINANMSGGGSGTISMSVGGTIYSFSTGILAQNNGTGDISIITQPNMDIFTATGDGIDAFATGGGNVLVHLLDGAINSNTTGSGACPSSVALCLDPYGIHATAVGSGNVTVITDDEVHNIGPGAGIFTQTQGGKNTVTVNNLVTNINGYGVHAEGSGSPTNLHNGDIVVNVGTFTDSGNVTHVGNITTTIGTGILAEHWGYSWYGQNVIVNLTGNGTSVHVTNAASGQGGIAAINSGDAWWNNQTNAEVYTGNNTLVDVAGAGNNFGIQSTQSNSWWGAFNTGNAEVHLGNSTTVNVGLAGGNNDVGILAKVQDYYGDHQATVDLGNGSHINVGNASASGSVGVKADGRTSGSDSDGNYVSITGGINNNLDIKGDGATGLLAITSGNGSVNVDVGGGGTISITDTADRKSTRLNSSH